MNYTPEQIKQMARIFIDAFNSNDARTLYVLDQLKQKGWPEAHSYANIKFLAK